MHGLEGSWDAMERAKLIVKEVKKDDAFWALEDMGLNG